MSFWNYRVIEFVDVDGSPYRQIHEVHYRDNGQPASYAEEPATVLWTDTESAREARRTLSQMRSALDRPVLVERDFAEIEA